MASSIKLLSIASLLLDPANPRLPEVQKNQQATQLAIAKLVGSQIVNIAEDILANGLDPMALTAVVKDESFKRRFRVLEGNRRLLALKALETPAIIEAALSASLQRRLNAASVAYRDDPIAQVRCVVFDSPEDAWYWIELRHTGENGGVGLVRWGTNEQDRFRSRHGGAAARKPAGQILDFVDEVEAPPEGANSKILTNLQRLISTRLVRDTLGIETERGVVYSWFPAREVYKGLRKAVSDLRGETKVGDIYYEDNRVKYIKGYAGADLPDPATRLASRTALSSLPATFESEEPSVGDVKDPDIGAVPGQDGGAATGNPAPSAGGGAEGASSSGPGGGPASSGSGGSGGAQNAGGGGGTPPVGGAARSRAKPRAERDTVIPRGCALFIADARINVIYDELRSLQVETFSNACAVLLRVFIELSVDAYISRKSLMTEAVRNTMPLAKRLKVAASDLKAAGDVDGQIEKAVIKVADGSGPFGTSTTTFNQYVHNRFVFPKPSEIRTAWDELEPVVCAIWKR